MFILYIFPIPFKYIRKSFASKRNKHNLQNIQQIFVNSMRTDEIYYVFSFSIENIVDDIEQQKEDIADLDTKVDATMDTVIIIGDKVIEHDKEIGELEEGLEKIEERVDDVEEEQEEAKIKIEEIDNKVYTSLFPWLLLSVVTSSLNITYVARIRRNVFFW